MHADGCDRHVFPVRIDRASYVIPTVGIAMVGATIATAVAMLAGIAIAGRAPGRIDAESFVAVALAGVAAAGVASAAWWVRRRRRIHRERQVIIDADGLTYVRFTNRVRRLRWREIDSVEEREHWGVGEGRLLVYRPRRGWRLTIEERHYPGYEDIKRLTTALFGHPDGGSAPGTHGSPRPAK